MLHRARVLRMSRSSVPGKRFNASFEGIGFSHRLSMGDDPSAGGLCQVPSTGDGKQAAILCELPSTLLRQALTWWLRDSLGSVRSPRAPGARTRRAASTTVHRREGWMARREIAGNQPYPAYCSSPRTRAAWSGTLLLSPRCSRLRPTECGRKPTASRPDRGLLHCTHHGVMSGVANSADLDPSRSRAAS